jgi:hypothetical protein
MATYQDREAFIPYRRSDLIELCIEDGKLTPTAVKKFRDFCEILSSYYHFQLHHALEMLKDNFVPFNPDTDTKLKAKLVSEQRAEMEAKLIADFKVVLERANYIPLSPEMLELALKENSLIELKTKVDFDDFEQVVFYYRGDTQKTTSVQKFFQSVEKTIGTFERVVLLLKFKDAAYFEAKKSQPEKMNFTPGKIYLYFYKNIPKFDLEFLFPNIKISMTLKDRLLLGIPAIGAGVSVLVKIAPQLLLIIGVVWFVFFGKTSFLTANITEDNIRNLLPVLVAALSLVVALGGVGVRQYNNYNYKKVKFQKSVTDTLFFRSLANNASVFATLIDDAEEEECKEIILVYYHLITSKKPLTPEQLDNRIEKWMEKKFRTKIDFDINGPLHNLAEIRGKIVKDGVAQAHTSEVHLLSYDEQGCCQVPSLDDAKTIIDYLWDNAFLYSQ